MLKQKKDDLLPGKNFGGIKTSKGSLSRDNAHLRKVMNLLKIASWELYFKEGRLSSKVRPTTTNNRLPMPRAMGVLTQHPLIEYI
jgi:hypothetical protein